MHIVLYEPEIPPNTGTIARLCAATQTSLHLIEPLGFSLEDRYLKRAGLDYWPHVDVHVWAYWESFLEKEKPARLVATSARAGMNHCDFSYTKDDYLLFGPETSGLPPQVLEQIPNRVRIPIWGKVRSLNIANSASVVLYEAFRQTGELAGK